MSNLNHLKFERRKQLSAHQATYEAASEHRSKSSTVAWDSGRADKIIILWAELDERAKFHVPCEQKVQGLRQDKII